MRTNIGRLKNKYKVVIRCTNTSLGLLRIVIFNRLGQVWLGLARFGMFWIDVDRFE